MIDQIARKVSDGGRVDAAEALELYHYAPTHLLGSLADGIRARKHPDRIVNSVVCVCRQTVRRIFSDTLERVIQLAGISSKLLDRLHTHTESHHCINDRMAREVI